MSHLMIGFHQVDNKVGRIPESVFNMSLTKVIEYYTNSSRRSSLPRPDTSLDIRI